MAKRRVEASGQDVGVETWRTMSAARRPDAVAAVRGYTATVTSRHIIDAFTLFAPPCRDRAVQFKRAGLPVSPRA